jgi:hypothetical protein
MTGMFARRKALRGVAISWFARHGTAAVPLLVPAALGKPGDERTDAELALRFLAERFGKAEVLDAVTVHGEKAVDAVRTILDRDPLDVLPTRMPKIPGWLDLALLPQVRMAGGGNALPVDAVGHLVTMLAISKPGAAYAGVELVMEACDRASLAEFAWGLFERWQAAGFPAKDGWVLTALGALGSDETVRRLTPLVRKWPGEGWHQRAVAALDMLAEIGTDVALIHLHSIAQKIKFAGLKEKAQEKIEQIAADLNLSAEQLADRLVPDLGLEKDGSLVLDYGPRRFTVGFTEELKPYVSDEDGRPSGSSGKRSPGTHRSSGYSCTVFPHGLATARRTPALSTHGRSRPLSRCICFEEHGSPKRRAGSRRRTDLAYLRPNGFPWARGPPGGPHRRLRHPHRSALGKQSRR